MEQKSETLTKKYMYIVSFLFFSFGLTYYFHFQATKILIVGLLLSILCLASVYLNLAVKQVFLFSTVFNTLFAAFFAGDVVSPILIWMPLIPLAGYYLGIRTLYTYVFTTLSLMIYVALSHTVKPTPEVATEHYPLVAVLAAMGSVTVSSVISKLFVDSRDKLYSSLVQNEKLSTIGTMSAGIAHQIGNTLNSIASSSRSLKRDIKKGRYDEQRALASLGLIEKALDVSKEILSGIDYATKTNETLGPVNLSEAITSAVYLSKGITFERVQIKADIDKSLMFMGYKNSILQILLNLIANSVDAIDSGRDGIISIEAEAKDGLIDILFSDNGHGIDKDQIENLFIPFKTSKTSDKGSGLGLYLVKEEVSRCGGHIKLIPSDTGACFKITLKKGVA